MAGTGVSSGGAGMLRARRRDVSVKPNRKLDRKSSRGMIYENEELRLRTIHINAEVEQGQNDIKKLRKENEQLRREIWSLRDEYDKLEEIVKSQKNREDSEDYEYRSEDEEEKGDEDEAEDGSDYSGENDEEEEDGAEAEEGGAGNDGAGSEDRDHEERLENAENQKISSEKMNNSLHRLHVEFDDLSVVDEEEEVKRDRERKDIVSSSEKDIGRSEKDPNAVRMDAGNSYSYFPSQYGPSSGQNYYSDCPFTGVAGFAEIVPIDPSSMMLTPCSRIYDGPVTSVPNFVKPGVTPVPPRYNESPGNNRVPYGSPIGWRSNIFTPDVSLKVAESYQAGVMAARASEICPAAPMFTLSEQLDQSTATATGTVRANSVPRGTPIDDLTSTVNNRFSRSAMNALTLLQRRNVILEQRNGSYDKSVPPVIVPDVGIETPGSAETLTRNGWDNGKDRKNEKMTQRERLTAEGIAEKLDHKHRHDDSTNASTDRPKHFFAPLHPAINHGRQDSIDKTVMHTTTRAGSSLSLTYFENFDTGRSSSSDRTNSTVVSARHNQDNSVASGTGNFSDGGGKGSADIYVNGAVPAYGNDERDWSSSDHKSHRTSDNFLIDNGDTSRGNSSSGQGSNNPLVKSISCQDLTSEQLKNSLFEISRTFNGDGMSQKLTKSDNTLDNPLGGSPKPFRSQLNVTLKLPGRRNSPDTPEIPELPTIDYRMFTNRFLKTVDQNRPNCGNYGIRSPITGPMSTQANERGHGTLMPLTLIDYPSSMLTHSFTRRLNLEENADNPEMRSFGNDDVESARHRVLLPSSTSQTNDSRIISSPKLRSEFQVTSFEQPKPRNLLPGLTAFDLDTLRRTPAASSPNPIISNHQKLYQNVAFVPGSATAMFCPSGQQNAMRMFFENNQTLKVPAQTQTSIDGGSNHGDDAGDATVIESKTEEPENTMITNSPTGMRLKHTTRKTRSNQTSDKRPLSPAAQRRRLRKQSSEISVDGTESAKIGNKSRKFSPATTTTTGTTTASEHLEDKTESRSSSSGQESPRKENNRRVSLYFNNKKRPSITSIKTATNVSIDNTKDGFGTRIGDPTDTTNSERERTNSASSREATGRKARKSSVSSGKVPWCACWGNGCI